MKAYDTNWISTGKANQILDCGIADATFRDKFKDCLPWRKTPGGQFRWLRKAVEEVAKKLPKTG